MTSVTERTRLFRQFLVNSFAISLTALVVLAAIMCWRIVNVIETTKSIDRADAVIAQANYTLRLAIDAETGERGYLISRNPLFLQPYRYALQHILAAFDQLAYDARRTPHQVARVNIMRRQYLQWLAQAQYEVSLANNHPSQVPTEFDKARGKHLMDGLRAMFDHFDSIETWLRTQRVEKTANETWYTLIICAVLSVVCGTGLGYVSSYRGKSFVQNYEDALSSSQQDREMLSATLFGIGDAVLVTDAKARVTMMNAVAESLTGWSIAEARNRNAHEVFNILNETTREVVESPIDRVIKDGVIVGLANHTVLVRRDGSEVPVDDSGAPIKDDDGKLVGAVLVFRDVTERKREEERIEQAYEKEHNIAEQLQRHLTMMPDADDLRGLEVETTYLPALNEAKVGGDFFDILTLNHNKVALVTGDISGKGLEAAAHTAEVKFALRAYLYENTDVAKAITLFNAFLSQSYVRNKTSERFVCLSVVVVDTAERTAAICLAGSEKVLVTKPLGDVYEYGITAPPIGVIDDQVFGRETVVLEPGDMIALSTDGITEVRQNGEFLGNDGFARLLSQTRSITKLPQTAKRIIDDVRLFADGNLSDDICFLLAVVT